MRAPATVRLGTRRTGRALAVAAAIATLGLATAQPTAAIPPGGSSPNTPGTSSSVSPTSLGAGDKLSFQVSGFPAGETLNIKIDDGESCSASAVHGACVYHQQGIPASGSVSGSFYLPQDLKAGKHSLRFLSSKPIVKDGKQVGVEGYTHRSPSFTVTSGGGAGGGTSSAGRPGSSGTDAGPGGPAAAPGAPGSTSGEGESAVTGQGGVVQIKPGDEPGDEIGPTPEPTPTKDDVAALAAQTDEESTGFPVAGVTVLTGLVVVSGIGAWLVLRRRPGGAPGA